MLPLSAFATEDGAANEEVDSIQIWIDQIESSLEYQTGVIDLPDGNAQLTVPQGFRYLDPEQSRYVLEDLWGNIDGETLGMLVPEDKGVLDDDSWLFTVEYDPMGYVEDHDAEDIDYNDLLKELQRDTEIENESRIQMGYEPVDLVGWAANPHYDSETKVLHWAKELKFGDTDVNTLNYNLRVLGRKGVFVLNAVANMSELHEVESNIDHVLASVEFDEGFKYTDFVAGVDDVAVWTIGGLVAGKVLAKAGFFALLLKFWKIGLVAVAGFGGAIWRFITGKKKEEEPALEEA
jgi:uncharacterized membrane-anchored protein